VIVHAGGPRRGIGEITLPEPAEIDMALTLFIGDFLGCSTPFQSTPEFQTKPSAVALRQDQGLRQATFDGLFDPPERRMA
jgi:hypothetical protein